MFVIQQEEFPKRHCQYFFLPEVQDFASDVQKADSVYFLCPLSVFGDAYSSGSGSDSP